MPATTVTPTSSGNASTGVAASSRTGLACGTLADPNLGSRLLGENICPLWRCRSGPARRPPHMRRTTRCSDRNDSQHPDHGVASVRHRGCARLDLRVPPRIGLWLCIRGSGSVEPVSRQLSTSCSPTSAAASAGGSSGPVVSRVFYWNATTGVKAYVKSREEFTGRVCPMPDVPFPPRIDDHLTNRKIEWFDAWDVGELMTVAGSGSGSDRSSSTARTRWWSRHTPKC